MATCEPAGRGLNARRRAVILAGGRGARLKNILPELPKPMAPVAGRPFLEWLIRFLARRGISEITVSTGHLAGTIAAHLEGLRVEGVALHCAAETEPLGTAGGFLNAVAGRDRGEGSWLVCNGDSLAVADLEPLYAALERPGVEAAILGLRVSDASRYGSLRMEEDGSLTGFLEKKSGAGLINAGIYLLGGELVAKLSARRPLSFELDVFPGLLAGGSRIQVCPTESSFLDIGTPETLGQAEGFIRANAGAF